MLKRTLVFSNPINLSLKNRQIVLAFKESPDITKTIPIEDVGVVIIESQLVHITIPLLNSLTENDVEVIFCNEHGMPKSLLLGMESNNIQGEVLKSQIDANDSLKRQLWKQIVEMKIRNQANLLRKVGKNASLLKPFYNNVKSGDTDNREGIAARLYFTELFGKDFIRDRNIPGINVLLNYGYTILRASVARALVGSGLFPAIGIFHHNRSNAFPLADDIMEPFRPYVDEIVFELLSKGQTELTREVKGELINVLYADTEYRKITRPLSVGLSFTTASLARCFAKEESKIRFPIFS